MKSAIALILFCTGLGIDSNGSQNAEIALGLCFFFGAINLARPAISTAHAISGHLFSSKNTTETKTLR